MNLSDFIAGCERISNFTNEVNIHNLISDLKIINESQKVTVPKFIDDWIFKAQLVDRRSIRSALETATIRLYAKNSDEVIAWLKDISNEDLRGLDEPQKVQVPQFVADWYEANKDDFETNLFRAVDLIPSDYEEGDLSEFEEWLVDNHTEPFQTLVNMHQFGYVVKKERRYTVKMRTTKQPLFYNSLEKRLFFSLGELATQFTFKQLEEAGFGEVFNSPLFEVEEVEG